MAKRKIYLHGRLRDEFGEVFEFDVETAGEAIRALHANIPERFLNALKEGSYWIVRGDEDTGLPLSEDLLNEFRLGDADLHIIPVVEGSTRGKRGGSIKAIAGIALIGIAIFASGGLAGGGLAALGGTALPIGGLNITWGNIALFGFAMAISGASTMLTQREKPKAETKREDSFSFSGPSNVAEQGNAIPLIYGRVMTGGIPISTGIDTEDISTYAGGSSSANNLSGSGAPGYSQAMVNGEVYNLTNSYAAA